MIDTTGVCVRCLSVKTVCDKKAWTTCTGVICFTGHELRQRNGYENSGCLHEDFSRQVYNCTCQHQFGTPKGMYYVVPLNCKPVLYNANILQTQVHVG